MKRCNGSGLRLLAVLVAVTVAAGCSISGSPSNKLGVPYRSQDQGFYCGPASILMWRLYDGLPSISQSTIANYIGCSPSSGVSAQGIADGVNHFTYTNDTFWDLPGGQGDPDTVRAEFFSRQITSIDLGIPVIAIVEGGLHAGVVNGGKWHTNSSGTYVWDYVYFHDPDPNFGGADIYWGANSWMESYVSSQVISTSAALSAPSNFTNYGDEVTAPGRDWPPSEWPPEY